jgi:hypothetical protein
MAPCAVFCPSLLWAPPAWIASNPLRIQKSSNSTCRDPDGSFSGGARQRPRANELDTDSATLRKLKHDGSTVVEVKSSHVPMLSRPNEVLAAIRKAAAAVAAKHG